MSTDVQDRLGAEHASLQQAVRRSREHFQRSEAGAFAQAMWACMEDYHAAREQGVEREDACRGIEAVLRQVWEKPVSKFAPVCSLCDDIGRRERRCTDEMRCGRERCVKAGPAHEHNYLDTCGCEKGDRFRPYTGGSVESEIAAAGKTRKKKPTGWSRA